MGVKPIPDGFHAVTPYLVVKDVGKEIEFLQKAFDAKVRYRMDMPSGCTSHAEVQIRDSIVMMGMASEQHPAMPVMLYLYVEDCDAAFKKAVAAGGKSMQEPKTMFYGDRSGAVTDESGNQWWVATHVEDVSEEELAKRAREAHKDKVKT
jgi:PhnB protein